MPGFFRTLALAADDAHLHPDAMRRMRAGDLGGILLRGVYDAAACARLCERLAAGEHGLARSRFPPLMGGSFLGINLNLAHPALVDYFVAAATFRDGLGRLFEGMADLEPRVTGLLAALDGGRGYRAAPGPAAGLDHMFTTIRSHPAGAFIPAHFDNEQAFRQSYRFVQPNIGTDLFSFVLAFSRADEGGALEIFDTVHDGRPWRMADGAGDASGLDLADVERVSFRLAPGELILFNSGRYLHQVSAVAGAASRWTACSFMAEGLGGDMVHCWG